MILKPWDELPDILKNQEVKKYYDILSEKKTQLLIKRGFDIVVSSAAIALLSPFFAAVSVAIKCDSEGPVFFRQRRVTQFGKIFKIHKFRSMVSDADNGNSVTVSGDSRITKVGEFIRDHKLDELSQLIDVLEGKMSFVGTRPEVEKYVDAYSDEMYATLLLPAGITSSASARYRYENKLISQADDVDKVYIEKILPEKMKFNLNDIEEFSVIHDLKILINTALVLITGDRPIDHEKPLIALITNHEDDVYCFRKELIEALKDKGYDVLISCPEGEKLKLLGDGYTFDYPKIDRRGTSIFNDALLALHYFMMLFKLHPDAVLAYTIKPNIYASFSCRVLEIPVINNITGFGSVLNMGQKMQDFVMNLFRHSLKRSAHIFFQNSSNQTLAEESGIIHGTHSVIPGSGVNTERFFAQPYPDDQKIVFNYIGRVVKDKGIDDYIEAAKRIRKLHPCTEFRILGFIEPTEAHYADDFRRLEEEGIVKYLGSQNDIRPFIAESHATIHPSTYGEGMSNVLLESASSARPLITTDNPGCRETVIDGETGFIYKGGNVDALVETIEKFLALSNDERKEMGLRGREYVKENFSRDIVIKAYLDKIDDIIARG